MDRRGSRGPGTTAGERTGPRGAHATAKHHLGLALRGLVALVVASAVAHAQPGPFTPATSPVIPTIRHACALPSSSFCEAYDHGSSDVLLELDLAAKVMDVRATERNYTTGSLPGHTFTEYDPIVRPLVPHPVLFYGTEAAEAIGTDWLGDRMRHSTHGWIRALWWVPQVAGMSSNVLGAITSTRHGRP